MKLARYLKPGQIRLRLRTETPAETPDGWSRERLVRHVKESVLRELVECFEASGRVVNPSRLFTDLLNRERKASTGIGEGVAVPHVRTLQARDLILVFARSEKGVEFDAIDGKPVHLFFGVVAPPYNDRLYLQVYRRLMKAFLQEGARERMLQARDEHEAIKILSDTDSWDPL